VTADPTPVVTAYIGLGGNVGDVRGTFVQAVAQMRVWPQSSVIGISSVYRTPPWGGVEQDDYLNAVVALHTQLKPESLHSRMLDLERIHGREREQEKRWGPRTLDLDLLLYGSEQIHTETLQVPHPRMTERAFVMVPLLEIAPEIVIPGHDSVTRIGGQWQTQDLSISGISETDGH
jgi:2-amino-4-hydroxy-6-hydroxymethyldihydropteridine diphosphokinase